MNFPSKRIIKRSVLPAALCGFAMGALQIAATVKYALQYAEATSVEFQVNYLLEKGERLRTDCANPTAKPAGRGSELMFTPREEWKEFCAKELAKADSCKAALERVTGGSAIRPIQVTNERLILSAKECGFLPHGFWANFWINLHVLGIVMPALIGAGIIGVVSVSALWLLEYPHVGWRRLILVVAPLVGIGSGAQFEFPMPAILFGSAIALGTPAVCLVGRELFLWIKNGFDTAKDG